MSSSLNGEPDRAGFPFYLFSTILLFNLDVAALVLTRNLRVDSNSTCELQITLAATLHERLLYLLQVVHLASNGVVPDEIAASSGVDFDLNALFELGSDFPPFPVVLFLQRYPDHSQLAGPTPCSIWTTVWSDYLRCAHASMDWIARAMRVTIGILGERSAWRWTSHSFSPSWVIVGEDYADVLLARDLRKTSQGLDLLAEAMRSRGILGAIADALGVVDVYAQVYCDDILIGVGNLDVFNGVDLASVVSALSPSTREPFDNGELALLSSEVKTVEIHFRSKDHTDTERLVAQAHQLAVLRTICASCPHLQRVHISHSLIPFDFIIRTLVPLASLKEFGNIRLRSLKDIQDLGLLPSLVSLTELSLGLYFYQINNARFTLRRSFELPHIRALNLLCTGPHQWHRVVEVITHLHTPTLSSLSLQTTHDSLCEFYSSSFQTALAAMTNHWSRLRSMSIAIKRDNPYEQDSVVPLSGMLQTLSALSTLADLTITLHLKCPRISLSSEDIQAAVSAWPALESLRLYTNLELAPVTSNLPDGSARVTIDALAHFARGCSELKVLHLRVPGIDATVLSASVDEEDLTKGTTCTQRTLKELVLGGVVSSCQDWTAVREGVVQYASELFPVANVYLDSSGHPKYCRTYGKDTLHLCEGELA
ncbi:uncharacterized protein BXZ73DRAFT_101546 [Epithele typhae]|uniref:uncharacterized protein n=1 Tax=Epithele typhae TaxID=378194 RepID=UPI002007FF1F|nr:uncharacterized protein BXZ73DRAFT_101546 [Epithele typhae]KAH9931637.1 hypothetical protein BXZ73DRAFT_101546 [Epithele typhae]